MTLDGPPLFDAYPSSPGWKRTETSHRAAQKAKGRASCLRDDCLRVLKEEGPKTADETAQILGENILSIRPRYSELVNLGLIEEAGVQRKSALGNAQDVYRLKAAG